MKIIRVTALPQTLEANTLYLLAEANGLSIVAVGSDGETVKQTIPGLSLNAGVLSVSGVKQVRTGEDGNGGEVIKDAVLKKTASAFFDNGTNYAFDYSKGSAQRFAPDDDGTVSFSNFIAGQMCDLAIEGVNLGSYNIDWPAGMQWLKSDGSFTANFAESGVALNTSGLDFIAFWTRDGGTTIYGKVFR